MTKSTVRASHFWRVAASICFVATTLVTIPTSEVSAQSDSAGIRVSNAIVDAPLNAGDSTDKMLTITNTSSQTLNVKSSVTSLSGSVVSLPSEYQTTFDASTWITMTPNDFDLNANSTQQVTAHIQVPGSAEAGGHYATITFATARTAQPAPGQSQLDIRGSVNAQAIVTVGGNVKTELKGVGKVGVAHFNYKSPINFNLTIKNTGNVHVLPQRIAINIYARGSSDPTTRLEVPPSEAQQLVLPDTSKTYTLPPWTQLPSPGWFRAQAIVEYSEAGGKSHVLTLESPRFYVIPLAIIIVLAIILVVGGLTGGNIYWRRRHRKKTRHYRNKAKA